MEQAQMDRIEADPNYQKLVAARSGFGWTLALIMMAVYFGLIALIAFNKALLAVKIGSVTSLGIGLGFAVIVFAFIVTAIYVQRANREFDDLSRQIRENA